MALRTAEPNSSATKHALVLAGAGRFADQWHDFRKTSERIVEILDDSGFATALTLAVDDHLADLTGSDLVVLNVGPPTMPDLALDARDHYGLLSYLQNGGALLAMHWTCSSLPAIPEWEDIMGGIWVRGTSEDTGYSTGHILVHPSRHPIVANLADFDIKDDLYCYLRTKDEIVPLMTHRYDGIEHPLLWARTYGPSRVVYDALGHTTESFESATHREILGRSSRWLVGLPF